MQPLVERMRATGIPPSKAAFICFDCDVLRETKRALPKHRAYLLGSLTKATDRHDQDRALRALADTALQAGLDGVDIHAEHVRPETIRELHQRGLNIFAWTINDPAEAERLLEKGMDGITTDRPAWLRGGLLDE